MRAVRSDFSPMSAVRRRMRQRQYSGSEHRVRRRALEPVVALVGHQCVLCPGWIAPGSEWDLAHAPDRRFYLGPAHVRCNRATSRKDEPLGLVSREW